MMTDLRKRKPVLWMTVTAMLTAANIVLSMSIFSIPVPGGHFYLNDVIIDTAALLLDPLAAFIVGGVGAFLGDAIFYPAPMFVSLVTHGLQAIIVSLCAHKLTKFKPTLAAAIGVTIGALIMVLGYTVGRAYIYSTPEYAIIKLPFEFLQACVGAVGSMILVFVARLDKAYERIILK